MSDGRVRRATGFRLADLPGAGDTAMEAVHGGAPYDVLLGSHQLASPQWGVAARTAATDEHPRERSVAFDLNHVHCLGVFGQPGAGKSYTMGTLMEMACQPCPGANALPSPLCVMMFHYSASEVSEPEFVTMAQANTNTTETDLLHRFYGVDPRACDDVVIMAPANAVPRRTREFPGVPVVPLLFHPTELRVAQWKILMGAVGEKSLYLEVLKLAMKRCREHLSVAAIRREILESDLSQHEKDMAGIRLDVLDQYIDAAGGIMRHCRPGRLIIVDLRDEFLEKDEVFSLLIVLMQVFGDARQRTDAEWAAWYAGDCPDLRHAIDAQEQRWQALAREVHEARRVADTAAPMADQQREMAQLTLQLRAQYERLATAALERLERGEEETGEQIQKMVVYDEGHKFMTDPALVAVLVEAIREMRHKACSIMIASQDPPSIPQVILELSTHLILHKMTAPAWLAHIQTVNAALADLGVADVATLGTGEAWVWATRASEPRYRTQPTKVRFRPRFSQHGGATKAAVTGTETEGV